ncbi:MAG TPA: hypothetical protein VLG09_04475 [Candidatus Saccharimonadales bacterium]|nr:hypothetical protein [Candidatus Saccharimonadales bacterium]
MPLIISLVAKLRKNFKQFTFVASDQFRWSPVNRTIFYDQDSSDQAALLHELSHALLGHTSYTRDIGLLDLERDAWNYASIALSTAYGVTIADETIQDSLDTYRDWLHARSVCPTCTAVGMQTKVNEYKCIACGSQWRVNEARLCGLKRYKLT